MEWGREGEEWGREGEEWGRDEWGREGEEWGRERGVGKGGRGVGKGGREVGEGKKIRNHILHNLSSTCRVFANAESLLYGVQPSNPTMKTLSKEEIQALLMVGGKEEASVANVTLVEVKAEAEKQVKKKKHSKRRNGRNDVRNEGDVGTYQDGTGAYDRGQDGTGAYDRGQDGTVAYDRGQDGTGAYDRGQDGTGAYDRGQDGSGAYDRGQDGSGAYDSFANVTTEEEDGYQMYYSEHCNTLVGGTAAQGDAGEHITEEANMAPEANYSEDCLDENIAVCFMCVCVFMFCICVCVCVCVCVCAN